MQTVLIYENDFIPNIFMNINKYIHFINLMATYSIAKKRKLFFENDMMGFHEEISLSDTVQFYFLFFLTLYFNIPNSKYPILKHAALRYKFT